MTCLSRPLTFTILSEDSIKVQDVSPCPALFRAKSHLHFIWSDDRTQEVLKIELDDYCGSDAAGPTLASTTLFSGQATRMKHSISRKLASFAGFSFPTLIV